MIEHDDASYFRMQSTEHHSNITCIDNKCRVSKVSSNMYKVSTMAKVIVLRYTHLLNWFRVSKGYTHVQYINKCIVLSLLSWVTRARYKWAVLTKSLWSETGIQQCIWSSYTRQISCFDAFRVWPLYLSCSPLLALRRVLICNMTASVLPKVLPANLGLLTPQFQSHLCQSWYK